MCPSRWRGTKAAGCHTRHSCGQRMRPRPKLYGTEPRRHAVCQSCWERSALLESGAENRRASKRVLLTFSAAAKFMGRSATPQISHTGETDYGYVERRRCRCAAAVLRRKQARWAKMLGAISWQHQYGVPEVVIDPALSHLRSRHGPRRWARALCRGQLCGGHRGCGREPLQIDEERGPGRAGRICYAWRTRAVRLFHSCCCAGSPGQAIQRRQSGGADFSIADLARQTLTGLFGGAAGLQGAP